MSIKIIVKKLLPMVVETLESNLMKYYNYSMKNIPIPSEKLYKITLLEKVELLVKRIRWKAPLFENNNIR